MLEAARFEGYARRNGHLPEMLLQRVEIDRAVADREMLVSPAMIVVQVQVKQSGTDRFEPFIHRSPAKQVPVPGIETMAEKVRINAVHQLNQRIR